MFGFSLGFWAIQPLGPGTPGGVIGSIPHLPWVSSWMSPWLATPTISAHIVGRKKMQVEAFVAWLVSQSFHWKSCLVIGDGQFRLHIPHY